MNARFMHVFLQKCERQDLEKEMMVPMNDIALS